MLGLWWEPLPGRPGWQGYLLVGFISRGPYRPYKAFAGLRRVSRLFQIVDVIVVRFHFLRNVPKYRSMGKKLATPYSHRACYRIPIPANLFFPAPLGQLLFPQHCGRVH